MCLLKTVFLLREYVHAQACACACVSMFVCTRSMKVRSISAPRSFACAARGMQIRFWCRLRSESVCMGSGAQSRRVLARECERPLSARKAPAHACRTSPALCHCTARASCSSSFNPCASCSSSFNPCAPRELQRVCFLPILKNAPWLSCRSFTSICFWLIMHTLCVCVRRIGGRVELHNAAHHLPVIE